MQGNRTAAVEPSQICLTAYRFEKLGIDIADFDPSETHNVRLNVEVKVSSPKEAKDDSKMYRVVVSASLGPVDDDEFHRVDARISGDYVSDKPEDDARASLLTEGAQELYSIMKSTVYSSTSGELMLPAVSLGRPASEKRE